MILLWVYCGCITNLILVWKFLIQCYYEFIMKSLPQLYDLITIFMILLGVYFDVIHMSMILIWIYYVVYVIKFVLRFHVACSTIILWVYYDFYMILLRRYYDF